jgi:hypothetical protein
VGLFVARLSPEEIRVPLSERSARRAAALAAAIDTHQLVGDLAMRWGDDREDAADHARLAVRRTADLYAAWIDGTTRVRLIPGLVVDEASGAPAGAFTHGDTMAQLNTGQKFDVTADTEDAAGYDTAETIEWSISDEAVATLQVSEDTKTCTVVSGAPGSAVLTATLPNMDPPLSATLAVDVVPAGTATINLVASDPVAE